MKSMKCETAGSIALRAHHGMCLAYFEGKGYSEGFTAHMRKMLDLFLEEGENGNGPRVRLVTRPDEICTACPNCEREGNLSMRIENRVSDSLIESEAPGLSIESGASDLSIENGAPGPSIESGASGSSNDSRETGLSNENKTSALSIENDEWNSHHGSCRDEEKVHRFDCGVLNLCGLKDGQEMEFGEFVSLVQERILSADRRSEICGGCQWESICSARASRWESRPFNSQNTSSF